MASSIGQRGKYAERKVKEYLEKLSASHATFAYERVPDARSAGGRFKKVLGDFLYFAPCKHGVLEVKESGNAFRLPKDKLAQISRLKARELAGGVCYVVVYHTNEKLWRLAPVSQLEIISSGSWDLRCFPTSSKLEDLLKAEYLV